MFGPLTGILINLSKIRDQMFLAPQNFVGFLCVAAAILAPWKNCLAGHRVLIGKAMHLEKMDAARSKGNPLKHFAPRQGTPRMRHALSNDKPAIHTFTYVKFCK
jgi:hypothetical protein